MKKGCKTTKTRALPVSGGTDEPAVRTETPLALGNGAIAKIVSFQNLCDAREHIALVFPPKDAAAAPPSPLVRLHSECLTGDVLGSAHCDCGSQLREAKTRLGAEGGILLYLRQEGRGIGLYNKLDAYRVQHDLGLDTFTANRHIGFADDLRDFRVAAQMLQAMGVQRVRILTNNPDKAAQLEENGITVEAIIPTERYENISNRRYLQAKKDKGHLL